ncbi:MAG: lipopolysaccharide kinase InaA family protein [Pseudomonas sp.]|jgi:hypothetical protein|nr:lipopolysaccharide kinase InaA family protein [Pseudomonas sp.]MDD2224495.1 lipopolysaccharide kinase InaA family protein [Pseudomonas sp.]MDY0415119.1 lipopolysaccharide kinase InaA family protein [Pseudomonas sp.]NLO54941.1 lipopolysaccharide kinase [Gammaproteobacteria bacterium]
MNDFIDPAIADLLAQHQLNSFAALWDLQLDPVDEPNTERGGWSSVAKLTLEGQSFYLKRQINHLTRSIQKPFGEPTFAREMRNIQRYQQRGIPALRAAYFAQRQILGEQRAILMTHALDGWKDLEYWQQQWPQLSSLQQQSIIHACAQLARTLHHAGQMHGCFYPKHIFLQEQDAGFTAQLIDLEKTRRLLFARRDRIKDLEPLFRRSRSIWGREQVQLFLHRYLDQPEHVADWLEHLDSRRRDKEAR